MKRVVLSLLLVIIAFILPWWIVIIVAGGISYFFVPYLEGLLIALIIDLVYGPLTGAGGNYKVTLIMGCVLLGTCILKYSIQKYVR